MKILFLVACTCVWVSCQKEDPEDNLRSSLYEKFNGKYKLVSSFSNTAVDLNNDGVGSFDLLKECSMVMFSVIEIRMPSYSSYYLKDNEFVFSEFWPTENDSKFTNKSVIPVYTKPVHGPNYDIYAQTLIGKFEKDYKSCTFNTAIQNDGKNTLIKIKSVEMLKDETIKVCVDRKLFTMNGWVKTEVVSIYKRFEVLT